MRKRLNLKRLIFGILIFVALFSFFFLLLSLKPERLFQPPKSFALSVHQQSLKFKIEEALPVDLDSDGRTELVIRDALTKRLFLVYQRNKRWVQELLPVPSKGSIPVLGSNFDTKPIPSNVLGGKGLLEPLNSRCLPLLLHDGRVILLWRNLKGRWWNRVLIRNAKFMLAGDLDDNGQQNDVVIAVLPNRLLWFVAQSDKPLLSLQDQTKVFRYGKVLPWGRLNSALTLRPRQWFISHGNKASIWVALWCNRLVSDVAEVRQGDLDGDGILDEAKQDFGARQSQVWLSKNRKVINLPIDIEWALFGDLNSDGRDEIVEVTFPRFLCYELHPLGQFVRFSYTLPSQYSWGELLGVADVDGDGWKEVVLACYPKLRIGMMVREFLLRLSIASTPLPDLLLVQRTKHGWNLRKVKVFSMKPVKQRFDIRTPKRFGYFGGRLWLFASSNCGATISCFYCRLKDALASLRGGYFTCPHSYDIYWQETHFWAVHEGKAIEALRLDAILARKFVNFVPKGVDLDGDGKGEAILTKTLSKNAVFVARYRNERWEVGKVERPCRLVSLSLSHNPRPCLIAVWEDGTVTQISVPSKR